jgi:PAP2 superfamily
MKIKLMLLFITAGAFILPSGCKKQDADIQVYKISTAGNNSTQQIVPAILFNFEVPLKWYALANTLIRKIPSNAPPVAARTFGYMGLALYESIVPGIPAHQSIQDQLNGLPTLPQPDNKKYYYPACANAALANMVHHMIGNTSAAQNFTIDSLENAFNTLFKSQVSTLDIDRSASFGNAIANALYYWSTTDGGDKAYLHLFPPTYIPPTGPGLWVAQPGQAALLPYWGNNRTFIAGNAASTQPLSPLPYSTDPSSQFYKEELEVYNESINQVPEHRTIALYWAAIPPPCVSTSILGAVLADKGSNLASAAEAYCKLGMAISDAFVSCWKTKYQYNQVRPVSFIRANFNASWTPLIPTPPFPDCTSGHSVQTGAAARVLADFFGNNTSFTDYSINDLGFVPRTFAKFSDYANEVGLSRIYGGIHIRSSDFVGLDQGDLVGRHVSALQFHRP